MAESDSKRIARQWNREIEADLRQRAAAEKAAEGPWKAVVWGALWLGWLLLLAALVAHVKSLG